MVGRHLAVAVVLYRLSQRGVLVAMRIARMVEEAEELPDIVTDPKFRQL
jgi:hypothetical protein